MKLPQKIKEDIQQEWETVNHYNGHEKAERHEKSQFYTPPSLIFKMLEEYEDTNGTLLDPSCGSGNLLAAAVIAGFDPQKCYGIELDNDILTNVTIPRLQKLGIPAKNLHYGNALNEDCYDFEIEDYHFDPNDAENGKVTGKNVKSKFGVKM